MWIISAILSLPVSIILVRWLMKCKWPAFEKGDVKRLLIAGILSAVVASVGTIVFMLLRAVIVIGPDTLGSLFSARDEKSALEIINQFRTEREFSFWRVFLNTLLTIGFVEELCRYLFLHLSTKNRRYVQTWMDWVICGGIVGTGFTIAEDLLYSSGGIVLTIFRALMPFHFAFGAIMGYFIGKAKVTGERKYYAAAILIPVLLHTLFDSSIMALRDKDIFIILVLLMFLVMMAVSILMIVKIRRWSKNGALDIAAEYYGEQEYYDEQEAYDETEE